MDNYAAEVGSTIFYTNKNVTTQNNTQECTVNCEVSPPAYLNLKIETMRENNEDKFSVTPEFKTLQTLTFEEGVNPLVKRVRDHVVFRSGTYFKITFDILDESNSPYLALNPSTAELRFYGQR